MRLTKIIQDGYDMVGVQKKDRLLQMIEDVTKKEVDCSKGDKLEDMIHDIKEHFMHCPHLIEYFKDVQKNLCMLVVQNSYHPHIRQVLNRRLWFTTTVLNRCGVPFLY